MVVFFFQAEDGIRDADVTGVQTCALPICPDAAVPEHFPGDLPGEVPLSQRQPRQGAVATGAGRLEVRGGLAPAAQQIGRASCRERVYSAGAARTAERRV